MDRVRVFRFWLSTIFVLVLAMAVTQPSALATKWTPATLSVPGTTQSELLGLNCFSSEACTAVGKDGVSGGPGGAFGEIWSNGTKGLEWTFASITRNPPGSVNYKNGVLRGVSCTSATVCVAVGSYGHSGTPNLMAQTRSGLTWTLWTPLVGSNAEFNDVSCVEPSGKLWCMAVGYRVSGGDDKPFAMTFDGSTWTETAVVSKPNATLKGIDCLSKAFCMAVGSTTPAGGPGRLLDEIWEEVKTGEWKWSAGEPAQFESGAAPVLNAVDCLVEQEGEHKGTNCMAVGMQQKTGGVWSPLAPTWLKGPTETKWSSGSEPAHAAGEEVRATGVSCLSAVECWTVGEANVGSTKKAWADQWTGGWKSPPLESGSNGTQLHDVACYAALSCKAVGWTVASGAPVALVDTLTP